MKKKLQQRKTVNGEKFKSKETYASKMYFYLKKNKNANNWNIDGIHQKITFFIV